MGKKLNAWGTEVGESLTFLQFTFCVPYEFCTMCIYYVYTKTVGPLICINMV